MARKYGDCKTLASIYRISVGSVPAKVDPAFVDVGRRIAAAPGQTLGQIATALDLPPGQALTRPGTQATDWGITNVVTLIKADAALAWRWLADMAAQMANDANHAADAVSGRRRTGGDSSRRG